MLSILIPTYNYSIVELVNRVHKQALNAEIIFEIIVIDDFSSDKEITENNSTIEKLSFTTLYKNRKNLGRTATRNLLAQKAKNKLLLFLDADVLPKYDDFIIRFQLDKNKDCQVIYGGVSYYKDKPKSINILRWKYGLEREAKSVEEREKEPFVIISQNLLIETNLFQKLNANNTNAYGLDILFSNNLKEKKIPVKHIDNPVYHLGLESNETFINKSLEAVKTTFQLEEKQLLESNFRPLQKSYQSLKKWRMISLFNSVIKAFKSFIKSNLLSENPSLFLFDLYKLQYYIDLKIKKGE